jgi:tryptophan-rich sensory protein
LALAVALLLFWRVRTVAGVLLVPYLAWVAFAAGAEFHDLAA